MANTKVTARLRYVWSDKLMQVEELRPNNSAAVLLDWPADIEAAVEAGVPPVIAKAVANALVSFGTVAFRWSGDGAWTPGLATIRKAPRRDLVRTAIERVTGRWRADLVLTRQASVVAAMFDHEWALQGQAALVFDAEREPGPTILTDLATRRDWRGFEFGTWTSALLVPAVDGSGVLVAAASERALHCVIDTLRVAMMDAGIALTTDHDAGSA